MQSRLKSSTSLAGPSLAMVVCLSLVIRFKVFTWTDRGHYQTGDTVNAGFQARTPDCMGEPVTGKAD
jgi:hypothetical protein